MEVVLQNRGEAIAEINWGGMHFLLKPGEKTFPMAEAIARKLAFRNQALEMIPTEDPPAIKGNPNAEDEKIDLENVPPEELTKNINRVGARPRKGK